MILQNPTLESLVDDMRAHVRRLFDRGEVGRDEILGQWITMKWEDLEPRLREFAANVPRIYHVDDWQSEVPYVFPLGKVNGRERFVHGTIDVLRALRGKIIDYKSMSEKGLSVIRAGAKEDHTWQTNVYRLLVERGYPEGESYSTYQPVKINSIEIFYLTMMMCVGTGTNLVETSDWRVSSPELLSNQTAEVMETKQDTKLKRGKRRETADLIKDYELQTYQKVKITSAIPEVELMDLDIVEAYVRAEARKRFEAFDAGKDYVPEMCSPETREWKCNFCPQEIKDRCDAHNAELGTPRIAPKKQEFSVEIPIEA